MLIYELSLATVVCINIIQAIGLNLITGYCGQISLGHAAFYGIGAYTAALMAKAGFPGPVNLLAAMLLSGAVGAVVGLTSLRVREDFLAITTMGVGFLFLGIVRQQERFLGGELGISSIPSFGLGKPVFFVFALMLVILTAAFSVVLKKTLKAITGVVNPQHAKIRLDGREISRMPTHRRAQLGLALTHQIVRPFRSLTLLDNGSKIADGVPDQVMHMADVRAAYMGKEKQHVAS
jgi:branched-subunit amino acid ABC-type transport system permease component